MVKILPITSKNIRMKDSFKPTLYIYMFCIKTLIRMRGLNRGERVS